MSTQNVANRLISLCREGKNMEAIEELYADNIVSKEMPGVPNEIITGKKEVTKKSVEWFANVQEFHSGQISDPTIAGNHFSCSMDLDVTFKDSGRQHMKELCVYEVNNGKIVTEQFFYPLE